MIIDVLDMDDASIEAEAHKLADAWDAGVKTRVGFAHFDAMRGAPSPTGRLRNDRRRNVARFDAAMKLRGYPDWIDNVYDDGAHREDGDAPDDEAARDTIRGILRDFSEDTNPHTTTDGARAGWQRWQTGDCSNGVLGDPVVDLLLSDEHAWRLHSDRIDMIDRARKVYTSPEDQALWDAMRTAEFKAILDIVDPHLGDEQRAQLRAIAITRFAKSVAEAKTAEDGKFWIPIGEALISDPDALTKDELETVVQAAELLLAKTKGGTEK
jgi:hypothetical protein